MSNPFSALASHPACTHRHITAHNVAETGEPVPFWSCSTCGRRFAPTEENSYQLADDDPFEGDVGSPRRRAGAIRGQQVQIRSLQDGEIIVKVPAGACPACERPHYCTLHGRGTDR